MGTEIRGDRQINKFNWRNKIFAFSETESTTVRIIIISRMASRSETVVAITIFVISLCLLNSQASSFEDDLEDNDVPVSKLSQNFGAPTLRFHYCYSCGYRKAYEEYHNILSEHYKDIIIDGRNYDPPGLNMFIARIIGFAKMLIITCILGGVNIFHYLNPLAAQPAPVPSWWTWCLENKLYSCLMLFFLCNLVEGQLIQSGAFEISLNDVPVWSKLETGRIPQPNELFQIIDNHMQMQLTDNILDMKGSKFEK